MVKWLKIKKVSKHGHNMPTYVCTITCRIMQWLWNAVQKTLNWTVISKSNSNWNSTPAIHIPSRTVLNRQLNLLFLHKISKGQLISLWLFLALKNIVKGWSGTPSAYCFNLYMQNKKLNNMGTFIYRRTKHSTVETRK